MVVRIRLHRFGRRNLPFFRIAVADSRKRRDGRVIEYIGTYNPLPGKDGTKEVATDVERARYWLSNGAQPSDRVAWLFNKVGIVPDVPQRVSKAYLEVPKSIKKELESA